MGRRVKAGANERGQVEGVMPDTVTGEVGMSITLNEKVLDACVILRA